MLIRELRSRNLDKPRAVVILPVEARAISILSFFIAFRSSGAKLFFGVFFLTRVA